jgi:predicted RNase H-like nuclease
MSDTQARLDAIREALHPRDVHHNRCATRHGRPSGPCDCHARRDLAAHEALDALAAELERVTAALRDEKRLRLEFGTLLTSEQIDAAYARAGGARAAQQGER